MRCRILSLVWLSAALAVPQVFAGELPTPAGLGQLESLLDSCSTANPQSAPNYKKLREQLVQGVSEKDLAEVLGGPVQGRLQRNQRPIREGIKRRRREGVQGFPRNSSRPCERHAERNA